MAWQLPCKGPKQSETPFPAHLGLRILSTATSPFAIAIRAKPRNFLDTSASDISPDDMHSLQRHSIRSDSYRPCRSEWPKPVHRVLPVLLNPAKVSFSARPRVTRHEGVFVATTEIEHTRPQPASFIDEAQGAHDPLAVLLDRIFKEQSAEAWVAQNSAQSLAGSEDEAAARSPTSSSEESEDTQDTETCVVAHPGSLCCSTTTIQRQPNNRSVVIQLKTTVKLSNPKCTSVSMSDLEQLGCMSGAQQLQTAAASLSRASGSRSSQARHDTVLKLLSNGHIVNAEKSTNQFGHVTYKCILEDPQTHHKITAIVKPSIEGHCHGWHRAEVEAVAYRLNRLLGMDYVPPCAYRKDIDVDWQHYYGGTFMYWAENGRELRSQPIDKWGVHSDVMLSDTRILDTLIQNSDRHHGHFLWAEHWAHGSGAANPTQANWKGKMQPVLIDHAAGFRQEAYVDMRHDNAFNTGAVNRVSAKTYLRLRCLSRAVVAEALGDLLTPQELDQVMRRRDDILRYFDELVNERGYDRVVIECA